MSQTGRDPSRPRCSRPPSSVPSRPHSSSESENPLTRIIALPGDGIGPEIMVAARELLARIGDFDIEERLIGGASIDEHGTALTDEVVQDCRGSDAVLL